VHALFEGRESPQGVLTDAPPEDHARPLDGLRVLVTRPAAQAEAIARAFTAAGAVVDPLPTVRIIDPDDLRPLTAALSRIRSYRWVVLTSANGAERLATALQGSHPGQPSMMELRIAAVGPATGATLQRLGVTPEVVPAVHHGEALAEALITADPALAGKHVLLARAADARPELPARLSEAGAVVDDVPIYETCVDRSSEGALRAIIEEGAVDWITFTASSTVRAFVEMVGTETGGARIATIGPVTAATVRELGLPEPVVAKTATAKALVVAVVAGVAS